MSILDGDQVRALIASTDANSLFIDPMLDEAQIGAVSIDLRLGYDFLVSVLSRKAFVGVDGDGAGATGPERHFQGTRRDFGERFILYPHQVVLATTLEYISLPTNVMADISTRSSYARLGIHLNTMLQPGYRGCASLELVNHGNSPIELVVGSRIVQARLHKIDKELSYQATPQRKYYGDVRPTVSRFDRDPELQALNLIADKT